MKSHALCAMMMALAWGAEAISSNTRGVRGQHHASLLSDFHQRREFLSDHDVGPMLKSAESMLMDLASRGGGTPLADLVAQIRPFILQMQDSIRAAYTSAQQTLTNFANDFSGCATARSTGESEATSLENIKKDHSDNHKTCRTAEKTDCDKFSLCESQITTLQGAKDSSCELYENAARAPGCDGIPPNPAETWKSYVLRAAIWFESERDSYLHKEAVCNNDTAKVEAKILQCRGSDGSSGEKKECEDQKEECDATQLQLETATCSWVTKVDDTCESFAVCANNVADGYEAQLTGIQTMEQQRKVEWHATERLLCLLGAYGADGSVDATKLQTCQNIGENTSHLTMTYPTGAGRPAACPDLLPHPCEADYISQEYSGLDAPAAACIACVFPGTASQATSGNGSPGGQAQLPSGGLMLHLDASTGNSPEDISGNSVTFQGASAVGVPTADISGRPAWDFSGHCMASEQSVQLNSEATIFIVSTTLDGIQTWGCQFWHGDHDQDFGVEQMGGSTNMNLQSYNDNGNCLIHYDKSVPTVWSGRTNSVARTFWKTTSSSSQPETKTASGSSGGRPRAGLKTLSVGGNNIGCNEKFNGYIGELIYYNRALSDAEMQEVTDSLVQKWFVGQAAAASNANGATGSSASTAGSSSQSSLPQDPGVEPPANYCDSGPGWMAGQCLIWAQKDENLDYLKYLLANGADVNAGPTAWPTWSPIFCALTYQTAISTEAVKLYIAYGADVNLIETDSGRTPVWAAESRGTAEQRQIMYDAGAVLCCGGNCEGVSAPNCADVTFP